ncbi:Potassium efflux system KefA protein [Arcticibacter svalbardensis MN12-7]|uniref:Potassium efflux system KefA protein n=1 Tax=Arcticibacter svalbardensis MN12-7 TaxID=1150600 RepID=R9GUZ7_9SPHI|nr:mechanosensitive ion channel [Arcticibacter svalbardensis]EOR92744.1 Potassium efflux system KefA protein [Arcticibacter svalbardensis MN12-7]
MDINYAFQLITDKLIVWAKELVRLLPNIALAAFILVFGFFIAKYVKNLLSRLIRKFMPNETLVNLFSSLIYFFLLGIVFFVALSVLKLDKAVTSMLAGAGIIGLALAFAFQDIAANFISGLFLSIRRPLLVGDIVKIKEYMGKVEEINLRDTTIRTYQGQMVIIPNKDVFQNPIENYSLLGKRRIDLKVGVSYGEDLEKVKEITLQAVKGIEGLAKEDEVTMFYTEFGDSSINYVIRLWINNTEQVNFMEVQSQSIINIKKAYDVHNIMIPFPIRTLDFGIKGGVSLGEMHHSKGTD